MNDCKGCFEEQRMLDDTFKQTKIHAQELANLTQKQVAIIVKQHGYTFAILGEQGCNCAIREIVEPV